MSTLQLAAPFQPLPSSTPLTRSGLASTLPAWRGAAAPLPHTLPDSQSSKPFSANQLSLKVHWADSEDDVEQAQRLRHLVFIEEMGASPRPSAKARPGVEADWFDPYCEHLIVRACGQGQSLRDAPVIGTYRLLTPTGARRVGGLYSDAEFDLTRLRSLRSRMAELGRSCVHPDWRQGGVIMLLWNALLNFMQDNRLETMLGCASVSMRDGGHCAASLWEQLRHEHLAPIEHQVQPRLALPLEALRNDLPVEPPALIKGYLRCGAKVLGAPAWDPDFNTADLPMMLQLKDLPTRYRQHFLRA
jgi:putative hemolysin